MESEFDQQESEAFIAAAQTRNFLTGIQADTLRRDVVERGVGPARLAIDAGMMQPIEAEITKAFSAPKDLASRLRTAGRPWLRWIGSGLSRATTPFET